MKIITTQDELLDRYDSYLYELCQSLSNELYELRGIADAYHGVDYVCDANIGKVLKVRDFIVGSLYEKTICKANDIFSKDRVQLHTATRCPSNNTIFDLMYSQINASINLIPLYTHLTIHREQD